MEGNKIKVNISKEVGEYIDKSIEVLKGTPWKTKQDLRSANAIYRLLQMAKIALEKQTEDESQKKGGEN